MENRSGSMEGLGSMLELGLVRVPSRVGVRVKVRVRSRGNNCQRSR